MRLLSQDSSATVKDGNGSSTGVPSSTRLHLSFSSSSSKRQCTTEAPTSKIFLLKKNTSRLMELRLQMRRKPHPSPLFHPPGAPIARRHIFRNSTCLLSSPRNRTNCSLMSTDLCFSFDSPSYFGVDSSTDQISCGSMFSTPPRLSFSRAHHTISLPLSLASHTSLP